MIDFIVLVIIITAALLFNAANEHHIPTQHMAAQKYVQPRVLPDTASTFANTPSWTRDFSSGGSLDSNTWNFEEGGGGWGNNELQTYTKDNARLSGGALTITAQKSGSSYTSARITTKGKFDFTYGRLDVVASLPTGKGVWPAIWLLPTDQKYSEGDNWLSNGEIDMVEGSALGDNSFSGSAHALNHSPDKSGRTGTVTVASPGSYHTYSLEWTPSSLNYKVDGKSFYAVSNSGVGFRDWPYDQRFHLIMNVAVGGDQSGGSVDANALPAQMKVRSISYYPYTGK